MKAQIEQKDQTILIQEKRIAEMRQKLKVNFKKTIFFKI